MVPSPLQRPAGEPASAETPPEGLPLFGAIEGGGTKFVLLVGRGPDAIVARRTIATGPPGETIDACIAFFIGVQRTHRIAALGIGMFGPIDLDRQSPTYGYITATPKPGWSHTDVLEPLRAALGGPVGWEHDVTAALMGERRWGAAVGLDPVVYMTVGTGVGVGVFVNGAPLHGLIHPEAGHLLMPSLPGDEFPGVCPFHGRCLEGLVSGPAIAARAGVPAAQLASNSPVWTLVAEYLAIGLADLMLTLSPRRIILGGGVLHQTHVLPLMHAALWRRLGGYLQHPTLQAGPEALVVPAALGDDAGILGALEVARLAFLEAEGAGAPTDA